MTECGRPYIPFENFFVDVAIFCNLFLEIVFKKKSAGGLLSYIFIYLLRSIGVLIYIFLSMFMNLAPMVKIIILRRSMTVRRSTMGVPQYA